MTAQLSCHVQKFAAICWSKSGWGQNEIQSNVHYDEKICSECQSPGAVGTLQHFCFRQNICVSKHSRFYLIKQKCTYSVHTQPVLWSWIMTSTVGIIQIKSLFSESINGQMAWSNLDWYHKTSSCWFASSMFPMDRCLFCTNSATIWCGPALTYAIYPKH